MKTRVLEDLYADRIDGVRKQELGAFSLYCDVKNVCSAIYFNAGVLISALVFLLVDKDELELGKVFSTLALLGYIFNFSICYSNYAIEALYTLKVYNQRIEAIITGPLSMEDSNKTKWRSSGRDNDARSDYNQSVDKVITTPFILLYCKVVI